MKLAKPLAAVALAAVLGLGLGGTTNKAEAAVRPGYGGYYQSYQVCTPAHYETRLVYTRFGPQYQQVLIPACYETRWQFVPAFLPPRPRPFPLPHGRPHHRPWPGGHPGGHHRGHHGGVRVGVGGIGVGVHW